MNIPEVPELSDGLSRSGRREVDPVRENGMEAETVINAMRVLRQYADLDVNNYVAITTDPALSRELPGILSKINNRMTGKTEKFNK